MYALGVRSHFDAAHHIRDYVGKCSREHGHRWSVELVVEGSSLDGLGMLVDFKNVKDVLEHVIELHLDHYQLNDSLGEPNLTAEFLARWLFGQMKARVVGGVRVASVTVWESPDCRAIYSEDDEDE